MANFKKGVALVLAAATAFTFAPVSTLGTPVVAEAAAAVTLKLPAVVNGTPADANNTKTVTLGAGIYTLSTDSTQGYAKVAVSAVGTPTTTTTAAVGTMQGLTAATADELVDNFGTQNAKTAAKYFIVDNDNTDVTFTFTTNTAAVSAGTSTFTLTKYASLAGAKAPETVATYAVTTTPDADAGIAVSFDTVAQATALKSAADGSKYLPASVKTPIGVTGASATNWQGVDLDGQNGNPAAPVSYKWTSEDGKVDFSLENPANGDVTLTPNTSGTAKVTVTAYDAALTVANKQVVASTTYTLNVAKGTSNITAISYPNPAATDATNANYWLSGPAANFGGVALAPQTGAKDAANTAGNVTLDTLVTTSTKLNVIADTSDITFKSEDTTIASVSADGTITANKAGNTYIDVFAAASADNGVAVAKIPVVVSSITKDVIKTTVDGKNVNGTTAPVDLDLASCTAANAVKSAKIVATSAANFEVTYTLLNANGAVVAGNKDDGLTLLADGTVTAGTVKADTTYFVKASTRTNSANTISGTDKLVKVVVNTLPADTLDAKDITLDMTLNKTATIEAVAGNGAAAVLSYVKSGDATNGEDDGVITLSGAKVTANKIGKTTVTITEAAVANKTRKTTKKINVIVNPDTVKKVSDLTVENSALVLESGKTATIGAKATNTITYTSADETVATVAADGTVTAVKAGQTTIIVKAAGSDAFVEGTITVPVVVAEKVAPVVVAKPAKVTGVKIANVKGAKAKISFKKVSKAAGYVVTYKVGSKTYKKTTTSTSVIVAVKKGAKVKATVKAFNYKDGNVKQYGKASKAVSKKTDKK